MDRNNWQTPPWLLDAVTEVLGPDWFDPCPVDPDFDGLAPEFEWGERCFVNPPYGRGQLHRWSEKAESEWQAGRTKAVIWLINYGCTKNRVLIKSQACAMCDLHRRASFVDPDTGEPSRNNDRDSVIYLWAHPLSIELQRFPWTLHRYGEIWL